MSLVAVGAKGLRHVQSSSAHCSIELEELELQTESQVKVWVRVA